jgi:3-methyladenine DNA glycosylase AlkD
VGFVIGRIARWIAIWAPELARCATGSRRLATALRHTPLVSQTTTVSEVLAVLSEHASSTRRDEMGPRYGIRTPRALGVAMADMKRIARQYAASHDLAGALWDTQIYEARIVASMVDEPDRVTPGQMDRWCADFDNWAICDTVCFNLFDRAPAAWTRLAPWSAHSEEYTKRAAFALLWSLALHDKAADDALFVSALDLVERAATDDRPTVTKGISMALKAVGKRNPELRAAASVSAARLAALDSRSARSIGRGALRDLGR